MKKRASYSKKEQHIITLGYLWRWGSIAIILIVPAIVLGICELLTIEPETERFIVYMSGAITMLCVGVYEIVGTALEFKHLLVALQLTYHVPYHKVNAKRDWRKEEKREYIGVGIIFAVLALAAIVIFTLIQLGIIE